MKSEGLTLVVGATGLLGVEILRVLHGARRPVRAIVRPGADPARRATVESLASEVVFADLKDKGSLEAACRGVTTVISAATAVMSHGKGDSIETVDEQGHLSLLEVSQREGADHFVFVSFPPPPITPDCALQRAKRTVEARLRASGLVFTIIQPANFCESWLSAAAGFDVEHGRVRLVGSGQKAVSWVAVRDVARFVAAATKGSVLAGRVVPLGGPEALSPLQVVGIFEDLGSSTITVEHVPETILETKLAEAGNSVEEALAAIALATARGLVVDPHFALALLPGPLTTVREYAARVLRHHR